MYNLHYFIYTLIGLNFPFEGLFIGFFSGDNIGPFILSQG